MVEFEVIEVKPIWSYFKKSGKKVKGFELAKVTCEWLTFKTPEYGDIVILGDNKSYMVMSRVDDIIEVRYLNTSNKDFKIDPQELVGAGCVSGKWK